MVDKEVLAGAIHTHRNSQGTPVSRMGYFCAPFQPTSGPYADKVIKVYQPSADHAMMERLATCHDDYARALRTAGVDLPQTELILLDAEGQLMPVVVQDALPSECMMRPMMQNAAQERALDLMEAAGQVIARFWNAADRFDTRIGFHPSIRNFAVVDGDAIFFDTFPPLIHYSRDEMGALLLAFSDSRLMRLVGPLFRARVTAIQDEWYDASETLVGLVGSACRLRPTDAQMFLQWGRDFARREMPRWADEAIPALAKPPRLPGYWTGMRKLLGLQGEPNI